MRRALSIFAAALLLFTGCAEEKADNSAAPANIAEPPAEEAIPLKSPAEEVFAAMSLEDKIWQLFFVAPEAVGGNFDDNAKVRRVGGIILFSDNITDAGQVKALLGEISTSFEIPVFLGVDEEGGKVSRLSKSCGVTDNGNMWDISSPREAEEVGNRLGSQLKELGFNTDFAPVADVLVNPSNKEIGKRSFSSDPNVAGEMAEAEVRGLQNQGVSAVLKHFPGHGSTSANSHNGLSVSERTLQQLKECELIPFEKGIAAGADFVLVSHMSLPKVLGDNTPCSLSEAIITDMLKTELNFRGIVITDALNMGAVSKYYSPDRACAMAVKAGADMLLMPSDLDAAFRGVLSAVQSGEISEERINESVMRILTIKEKRGLI